MRKKVAEKGVEGVEGEERRFRVQGLWLVCTYLSKEGKLITVSDVSKEKAQGQNSVHDNILSIIDKENEDLRKVQDNYENKAMSSQMVTNAFWRRFFT